MDTYSLPIIITSMQHQMVPQWDRLGMRNCLLSNTLREAILLSMLCRQVSACSFMMMNKLTLLGTELPEDLILVHEHSDHYSLQAAAEMSLEGNVDTYCHVSM